MLQRFFFSLIIGALLAGCATKPMEVASITPISSATASKSTDVYAKARALGKKVPDLAGDQILAVRTYMAAKSAFGGMSRGKEISGVGCKVIARDFSATVTTPAKIRVPIYRTASSPLSVQCSKPGFHSKTAEFGVYNKTKSNRMAAGANGGLAGVLIMAAVNGMSNEKTHEFLYNTPIIIMTPKSGIPKS